jgi:hypothetical protein
MIIYHTEKRCQVLSAVLAIQEKQSFTITIRFTGMTDRNVCPPSALVA